MNRTDTLAAATTPEPWDILVIGGGASGLGTALEAATRGYSPCRGDGESRPRYCRGQESAGCLLPGSRHSD